MARLSYRKAGTHEQNRYRLCLICLKKAQVLIEVKGVLKTKILNLLSGYNTNDERLPAVVCASCKLKVYRSSNNNCDEEKYKLKLPDYCEFMPLQRNTRNSVIKKCECRLCELVRMPTIVANFHKNNTLKTIKSTNNNKKCENCLGYLRSGHKCTPSILIANVKEKIENNCNVTEKEQLISSLLKSVINEKNTSTKKKTEDKNLVVLSQTRGKPLILDVKPKMTKNSKISNDELYKLQSDLNCSNNTIYKIAKAVRKGSNSNRIIEPHLRNKIVEKNHKLDSFFEERDFPFIREKAKNVTQEPERVIICKDTKGFINFVCGEREQNADELHFKFGIDGGGGFLKICVSLQIKEESKRMKIQNSTKKFKSSGVKKVLLLCAAPNVQENFTNVKLIWSALDINDLLGTVATDLKLANIITGLMTHTSTHPCTWCDAQSGKLNLCGNSRSIGNCVRNYECWIHEGKNYKKAKNYKNCVNLPVFSSLDSRKEILDIIPPPELHLMIGAVNTIFNDMMIKFEEVSLLWAKNCHVERSLTYGSPAFEGNQCKKLLDSVDKLRAICNLECLKFVKAFENLKKVVDSCFSSVLKDTYQNDIDEFQKSFLDLGTSVTPKIHALFHHVPQFCLKNKCGLGFYSEQAVESLHHDFSASWNNYKVLKSHPNYSKHLQRAVCEYNCHHI